MMLAKNLNRLIGFSKQGADDSRRLPSGFTLIEILVVIGIISIFLGFLVVGGIKLHERTKRSRTATTILQLKSAMSLYKATYGTYPSLPPSHPETWPNPYASSGAELNGWFLKHTSVNEKIGKDKFDAGDSNFLIDRWGQRLRYRKSGPERMLIWSIGPDGKDQIGQGLRRRAGDDISSDSVK